MNTYQPKINNDLQLLSHWFESDSKLLNLQYKAIQNIIVPTKGVLAVQLGVHSNYLLNSIGWYRHKVHLPIVPKACLSENIEKSVELHTEIHCSPFQLPFQDNSVDCFIIHHCLEFMNHPHLILKEVISRLKPHGDILLFMFNPYSVIGAQKIFNKLKIRKGVKLPPIKQLSLNQLNNWLEVLDCKPIAKIKGLYPSISQSTSQFTENLLSNIHCFGNGYYLIHIRKFTNNHNVIIAPTKQYYPKNTSSRLVGIASTKQFKITQQGKCNLKINLRAKR